MQQNNFKKDRLCYILEELFNYLISILVTNAYLAKLTSTLGFSDGLTAILSSFVTLGCCTQLLTGVFFKRGKAKLRVTAIFLMSQTLFMLVYLVPFIQIPHSARTALFTVLLLLGQFVLNIASAPRTNWFMSFVDDHKRGIFTAEKEAISLGIGFLFQMGMGLIIDRYETQGNIRGAFVVCAIVIFVLSVGHTLSLVLAKDREIPENNRSLLKGIKDILIDKKIRPLLVLSAMWAVAYGVAYPFFGTYTIGELGFSMSFLAVLSLVEAISRIAASIFLGTYADKHSFAKMLRLCYCMVAAGYAVAAFARPENGYVLYPIFTVLYSMAMGGINSSIINLIFDYVSPEKRTLTLSVRQTIYGVVGFLTSTAASPLLQAIQNAGNRFLGMQVYAQQVLSCIGFVCMILIVLYVSRVVIKLRPLHEYST